MSIFRIKCKKLEKNYVDLWGPKKITYSTGTAFPVRIGESVVLITSYHTIEDTNDIDILEDRSRTTYKGLYVSHCYELDFAIIRIVGYTGNIMTPHECIQATPKRGDAIVAIGFVGNDIHSTLSSHIISGMCVKRVNNGLPQHLIQIGSKLEPGYSGGPICNKSGVLGMILGGDTSSYILPMDIINQFLNQYETHPLNGTKQMPECCDLGITTRAKQVYVNGKYVECPEITSVGYNGSSHLKLFRGDVLLSIDGYNISQYDMLESGIPYWQLIRKKRMYDAVDLQIIRNNEITSVILCLHGIAGHLLPIKSDDIDLRYYMFAGMDFMALNAKYARQCGDKLCLAYADMFSIGVSQVIILKQIFPSEITKKCNIASNNMVLTHINNTQINDMQDVYRICEDVKPGNIKFTFNGGEHIELNHALALQESEEIAQTYIGKMYHNF
jgi:hypothetical protein